MAQGQRGNTVRAIDWRETFPFTEVFRSFRIATQPGKLLAALLLVIGMCIVGWVLDGWVGSQRVLPGEFEMYCQTRSAEAFRDRRAEARSEGMTTLAWTLTRHTDMSYGEAGELVATEPDPWSKAVREVRARVEDPARRAGVVGEIDALRPRGVFATALEIKVDSFGKLLGSAWAAVSELDWQELGLGQLDPRTPLERDTALGAVRAVAIALPGWLWSTQPWFFIVWTLVFVLVWSLLGGAIARMSVVEAATGDRVGMSEGLGFAFRRWLSFVLVPLLPLVFFGLIALLAMLGGLLFHIPLLDIIAALLWIVAVLAGVVIAVGVIAWAGAVNLMFPALAAEATDVFDAISRSYSYVVTRPWKFLFYTAVALIYGTITYAFVGLVIYLTIYLAREATAAWSAPFARMLPMPEFGDLRHGVPDADLGGTDRVAGVVIRVWFLLVVGLIAAYAISFYFAAQSLVYLLLRRDCDGTDLSQVHLDSDARAGLAAPAPVEPARNPDPADEQ